MKRLLLAALGALTLGAAPAHAATFTVNTALDTATLCNAITCSLRGAITSSTQNSEPDVINVPAGTFKLSGQFTELPLGGGVTIVGAGAHLTTIEGSGANRVFEVTSGPNRIANVTIAGGTELADVGGNVLMQHGADLDLDHVRITRGLAARGGGVATGGGGELTITHSLIDDNEARPAGQTPLGDGGGVLMRSTDNAQTLVITDSTIAFNRAARGAGLMARDQPGNDTLLQRVTIADNAASGAPGGGLAIADQEFVGIEDSIIVRNTGNIGASTSLIGPSNCNGFLPTTGGGNVESGGECGFELQNTTAGLATTLTSEGGQTPMLALPWESVAHDFAGACTGSDQRDVARPQGVGCDPGAFEATQPPPPPTPTPTPAPPVPTPTPTPSPTPVPNEVIVVDEARGTVKVKLPGAKAYVDLDAARGIPVGSTVDTRKGRVTLTSIPRPGASPETAVFFDGIFRVTQRGGITILALTEPLAACPKRNGARASAKKPKKRKLWGDGKGAFRTQGKYSAATVRGTKWLVEDSCAGTLTRVTQGSVRVTHGRRTIVVRAGKRYLARPRR